jgi:hypothetical protein
LRQTLGYTSFAGHIALVGLTPATHAMTENLAELAT